MPKDQSMLDPGDHVEYGITVEANAPNGAKTWIKAGVTVTVRDGESHQDAYERAVDLVEPFLVGKVQEWTT